MPTIKILSGEETGRIYEWNAGTGIRIGRNSANDFVIPSASVSGEHCFIEPCDGGWRIKDNDSTNGTRLNDQPISMAMLHRNDVIRFGEISATITGDDVPLAEQKNVESVDSIPRTTIVMRPAETKACAVDGFKKKSESKKMFNMIIVLSIIAIVVLLVLLGIKLA